MISGEVAGRYHFRHSNDGFFGMAGAADLAD
jgi:hypothetical protein